MDVVCTVLLMLISSMMTLGNEDVENVQVKVSFVQGSPCISATWDPPKTMAADVDYYSIALHTPSVTRSSLRTYFISNFTERTVNDCLVLKNTKYVLSLRVHYTSGIAGRAINVSVVTNYLQDVTFKQQGNHITVQCQVASSDTPVTCHITIDTTSHMNRPTTVLRTVTVQGSNVSLLLPRGNKSYSARVSAVNTFGASVERFGLVHNFTMTEETVLAEEGNVENNTTDTGTLQTDHSCRFVNLIVYVVISVNIMIVMIFVLIIYLCKGACQKKSQTEVLDKTSCGSSMDYTDVTKTSIVLSNDLVVCTKPELTAGHYKGHNNAEFPPAYTVDDGSSIKDEREMKQTDMNSTFTTLPTNQTTSHQ